MVLLFVVLHLDIFTRRFTWLSVIAKWRQIRVQSSRWTYERTALPYSFPGCGELFTTLVSVDCTSLLNNEIEDDVFDVNWNELFFSVPTHQLFELYSHFLAYVAVHWNHENTV